MRVMLASAASVLAIAGMLLACSGEAGPEGLQGPAGVPGATGPAGPTGPAGEVGFADAGPDAAMTGCTAPCHGFGNVVDQWKFSGHYKISALADEEPIWTSTATCGNCHAVDGLERRVAGTVNIADGGVSSNITKGHLNYKTATNTAAEAVYSGYGKNAIVHCTTCHAFTEANDPHNTGRYEPGAAPLRVASGPDDQSFIEKSPSDAGVTGQEVGKWKAGNTCVFCHKSRKDITFYITPANKISSPNWGPHEGPQTDLYSGKGGYNFAGESYGTSPHTTVANGCVSCHMVGVASNNNTPDHSMIPGIAFCKTCHTTYTGSSFDIQAGQSTVRAGLKELQAALNAKGLLTRSTAAPYAALTDAQMADGAYNLDKTRPGSGVSGDGGVTDQVLDANTAGVVYNYLIIARGKDFGVHNPTYTKQLLWDSIKQLTGTTPKFMSERAKS